MSVINEMLKDLDKRKAEQSTQSNSYQANTIQAAKPNYVILILVICFTAMITATAVYLLQNNTQTNTPKVDDANSIKVASETEIPVIDVQPAENNTASRVVKSEPVVKKAEKVVSAVDLTPTNRTPVNNNQQTNKVVARTEPVITTIVASSDNVDVIAAKQQALPTQQNAIPNKVDNSGNNNLTISTVDLSPEQLSIKRLRQAKRYLKESRVDKAQALLEEAVILDPYHIEARKQLAALWFGAQYYEQAVNLLSQGLSLSPNNEDYRIMLARVYAVIAKPKKAFQVLNVLKTSPHIEYQVALANMAAQSDHHSDAVTAYQKLLAMRPNQGHWWLGMAISLDSDEQYGQAIVAYQHALKSAVLSQNSKQFAEQRLQELGG
ncbi:tetratricopeptide repeat protein [Colwelliaceae bacterium BS250]